MLSEPRLIGKTFNLRPLQEVSYQRSVSDQLKGLVEDTCIKNARRRNKNMYFN